MKVLENHNIIKGEIKFEIKNESEIPIDLELFIYKDKNRLTSIQNHLEFTFFPRHIRNLIPCKTHILTASYKCQ